MNGKGSKPRHNHDDKYRDNFELIEWKKNKSKIKRAQLRQDVYDQEQEMVDSNQK